MSEAQTASTPATEPRKPSKLATFRAEMREIAAKRKGPHWGEVFTMFSEALEEIHAELAAQGVEQYQADQESEKKAAAAAAG